VPDVISIHVDLMLTIQLLVLIIHIRIKVPRYINVRFWEKFLSEA
jgi:hypothetical protein